MEMRADVSRKILDKLYVEKHEFRAGVLPTGKDVIQMMMHLLRPSRAGRHHRTRLDAARLVSGQLIDHWVFCNVYTVTPVTVERRVCNLYQEFLKFSGEKGSRKNANWKKRAEKLNVKAGQLFDIFCEDKTSRKRQELHYGVKMSDQEWKFLEDMRGPRKMLCQDFVDRKWLKTRKRKMREESLKTRWEGRQQVISMPKLISSESDTEADVDYVESDNAEGQSISKKRRLVKREDSSDPMPEQYKHRRLSGRIVRPEVYQTLDKLKSKYHMSTNQAAAAVVEVSNGMFGRKFKFHDADEKYVDLDTMPAQKSIRLSGKALTAMSLALIVDEIMSADGSSTITYQDDGSRKQGCGSFSVQGISINGKYRPLLTLPIASESRQNIRDLRLAVLNILSAVSGVSPDNLYEKIDYVMTDSTAHNLTVVDLVAQELDVSHVPDQLVCHVHTSAMFTRKILEMFRDVESAIGPDKIFSNFFSDSSSHDTVTEQFINAITRLISHDFDHKAWNYAEQFDAYILPKRNYAKQLKKERFSAVVFASAVALHHDVDDNEHITNNLACIIRSFENADLLRVMCAVAASVGIHLIEPYLSLTTSDKTTYPLLVTAMKQLLIDLTTTDPSVLLDLKNPAFKFVSSERFQASLYPSDILTSVGNILEIHRSRALSLLKVLLPRLADGLLSRQGNVFGLNPTSSTSLAVGNMDMEKLLGAPINNLNAERSVGAVQYELVRRGPCQLGISSDMHTKAKSYDLIESKPQGEFNKFRKLACPGGKLSMALDQWIDKQRDLKLINLSKREERNRTTEARRNLDLDKLRKVGGPFTLAEEIDAFIAREDVSTDFKLDRLYTEVRYRRDTSLWLPRSSELFRLKHNHANLNLERYCKNLKTYLSNIRSNAMATWSDFDGAVDQLSSF